MRTTSRLRVALMATLASASFLFTAAASPPSAAAATPTTTQPASPATTTSTTATAPSGTSPSGSSPSDSSPSASPAPGTAPSSGSTPADGSTAASPSGSAASQATPARPTSPSSHPVTTTLADLVIADALRHVGAPYVWGSAGPWAFDCSGLVYRVFADNGIAWMIDDSHSAYEQYAIFRARGLASRTGGEPGDLVVYGDGSHIGIYLGHGRVVSALVQGVRVTGVYALTTPFTAFLHTHLDTRVVTLASTSRTAKPATRTGTSKGSTATRSTSKPRVLLRHPATAAILRAAPTTAGRPLAVLAPGTSLRVVRSTRDRAGRTWDEVRTPGGQVGWVANWLLRA